jgi:hypothetical protein
MGTEGEEKKSFKVVDRRRFHEDGTAREGPDVQPDRPRVDPPTPPPAAAPPSAAQKPAPQAAQAPAGAPAGGPPAADAAGAPGAKPPPEESPNGLTFSIFLQSLAQQALMQLGLIPWPHGQRELHLDQARDTIDILQLLKVKTKGNLSPEENQLMDTVVYELKMSWVEVQQAIARSKGAPMPRPPGR